MRDKAHLLSTGTENDVQPILGDFQLPVTCEPPDYTLVSPGVMLI